MLYCPEHTGGSSHFPWKMNGFRMGVELRELRSNGAIRISYSNYINYIEISVKNTSKRSLL